MILSQRVILFLIFLSSIGLITSSVMSFLFIKTQVDNSSGSYLDQKVQIGFSMTATGLLLFVIIYLINVILFRNKNYHYIEIELPEELRTVIQQYLSFFKDYVKVSKKEEIDFVITQSDTGLTLMLDKKDLKNSSKLKNWFQEYIGFVESNLNISLIEAHPDTTRKEIDLLILKLENQITHLKNGFKIVEVENHLLKNENEYLKQISFSLASKDNVIHNQYIQGGNQQFANQIKNKKTHED